MPAPNMPGNTGTGRRTYDDPVTDEAARFLDRPLIAPDTEFGNPGEMIVARIRGIDFLERIGTWQAVERDLGRDDGEPRERVMAWLRDRATYLREHGDRPERATGEREPAPEKTVAIPERPSVPLSSRPFTDLSAYQDGTEQAVATDGGPHAAGSQNTSMTGGEADSN